MIRDTLSRLLGGRIEPTAEAEPGRLVSRRAESEQETSEAPSGDRAREAKELRSLFGVGLADAVADGLYNSETGELAPGFPITKDDVVVDAGCGEGGMAGFCARQGAHVIMVDTDSTVLEKAVKRALRDAPGGAEGHIGDASALPLPDAIATRVICTEVLEHVDDPAGVMKELLRVGKPGALYLLSVPGAASERLQHHVAHPSYFAKPNHIRIFQTEDFVRLVEDSGLIIEKRIPYGFFWTMHWLFFWQAGNEFGKGENPLLDSWTNTWREVMQSRDAASIRNALNELAPKAIAIVARKPG